MKNTLRALVCAAGLATLGFASGSSETKLIVNIPFDFVVSGKRLPAGEYRFVTESVSGLVLVQGNIAGRSVALMTSPGAMVRPDASMGASFEKHDGENHLTELVLDNYATRLVKVKPAPEAIGGTAGAAH